MGRRLDHATGGAGGADIATLATERDQEFVAAVGAVGAAEAMGQNAALQPESGTEYDILVYGELDTLVHTESGVTGTNWTYLEATEIAESGLGRLNDHLRVIVRTYGAGRTHEAIREIEWEFDRA